MQGNTDYRLIAQCVIPALSTRKRMDIKRMALSVELEELNAELSELFDKLAKFGSTK